MCYVLFDSGSPYSFISCALATRLGLRSDKLDHSILISTPVGKTFMAKHVYKNYKISIDGVELLGDLILLDMYDLDAILEMD